MADTPFKRILVGTLGSPWSQRALELAVNMAKAYRIELVKEASNRRHAPRSAAGRLARLRAFSYSSVPQQQAKVVP